LFLKTRVRGLSCTQSRHAMHTHMRMHAKQKTDKGAGLGSRARGAGWEGRGGGSTWTKSNLSRPSAYRDSSLRVWASLYLTNTRARQHTHTSTCARTCQLSSRHCSCLFCGEQTPTHTHIPTRINVLTHISQRRRLQAGYVYVRDDRQEKSCMRCALSYQHQ
jgi:hypothetical protein